MFSVFNKNFNQQAFIDFMTMIFKAFNNLKTECHVVIKFDKEGHILY